MEALAQILQGLGVRAQHLKQPTAISIEPVFMRKMLRFFKDTRAGIPIGMKKDGDTEKEEKKYGWCLDYTPPPSSTDPLTTALTVRLLARINRMLDEYINARVLYYFSVKQLEELKRGPDLDTLFYPDYGLCQVSKIPEIIVREGGDSIAIFLQKMRAHVGGLQDLDALYSMVLYGPGGTGKTTLVEALASSCDVPLVEVTPSDIVVRGVEALERRARAVFEALSLLTRTVILFDEFEPVLRKRKAESPGPDTVFSWLTPGMLPKLKTLHRNAKRRSVAYMLVTNLIGELDDAATRTGRFDEKIGIYPPDVLSRTGRFWSEADIFMQENRYIKDNPPQDPPKEKDLEPISKPRCQPLLFGTGGGLEIGS